MYNASYLTLSHFFDYDELVFYKTWFKTLILFTHQIINFKLLSLFTPIWYHSPICTGSVWVVLWKLRNTFCPKGKKTLVWLEIKVMRGQGHNYLSFLHLTYMIYTLELYQCLAHNKVTNSNCIHIIIQW